MAFPTNPTSGQRHQEPSGIWYTWKACATGGAWEQDRSQLTYYDPIPLGAIQAFTIGTAPKGWLLCDGSAYDKALYPELFAVLGVATLPDLRGEFLRGRKAGQTLGTHADWITGKPKTAFTGTTSSNGDHNHAANSRLRWHGLQNGGGIANLEWDGGPNQVRADDWTQRAGNHTHTVTINGGGDAETAPDHTLVDWYIKAAHAKVTLPQSGFLTAATTLHDGDVWQFDAVSNVFKNVPAATLISGMTVGTAPPTAPFIGQQYYKTDGFTPGLRVWTGTSWAFSSGGNVRNKGARIVVPGYFNQDPSDTATPGDDIGVAAKYYSDHVRLYANKGTWHPLTPEVGIASNAGKVVVADAKGDPTWGGWNMESTKWLDSTGGGATDSWTQDFNTKPQRYLKWDMTGSCTTQNCRLMLVMQQNGGWWNWSTHLAEAQAVSSYENGGTREEMAAIKSVWWSGNTGGHITEDNGSYLIKANTTWFSQGTITFTGDRAMLIAETTYTSDNNTPMRCIFRARWDQDMRKCNKLGLKYSGGTGWFVGHMKYQ